MQLCISQHHNVYNPMNHCYYSITNTIRPQRICNGSNGSWLKLGTISTSANSTFKDTQSKLYHATSKVGADKLLICLIKHISERTVVYIRTSYVMAI